MQQSYFVNIDKIIIKFIYGKDKGNRIAEKFEKGE